NSSNLYHKQKQDHKHAIKQYHHLQRSRFSAYERTKQSQKKDTESLIRDKEVKELARLCDEISGCKIDKSLQKYDDLSKLKSKLRSYLLFQRAKNQFYNL